jgi:hypothetical protein
MGSERTADHHANHHGSTAPTTFEDEMRSWSGPRGNDCDQDIDTFNDHGRGLEAAELDRAKEVRNII